MYVAGGVNMKRLTFALLFVASTALPLQGEVIDRIAAIVEREVITTSEIDQMEVLRFFPPVAGESRDAFRQRILDLLIAQALRLRDVERFGARNVPPDSIEARLGQIVERFPSEEAFLEAAAATELTIQEIRALIRRQLQVEIYIEEHVAPMIFISLEEIERYYQTTWLPQRRERGLPVIPLVEVREEIRTLMRGERLQSEIRRWTEQLRERANVDILI
jgi:hypothetical protein